VLSRLEAAFSFLAGDFQSPANQWNDFGEDIVV
jgi:hypothetical protein